VGRAGTSLETSRTAVAGRRGTVLAVSSRSETGTAEGASAGEASSTRVRVRRLVPAVALVEAVTGRVGVANEVGQAALGVVELRVHLTRRRA
jgi:hypothetical protein